MQSEMYTAAQGLIARQIQLDTVANNIANSSTTGFREVSPFFRAYNEALADGPRNPLNNAANNQPVIAGTYAHSKQGGMKATARELDFAIEGEGYFKLNTPDGPRYTRNGHFSLQPIDRFSGQLVNARGHQALDVNDRPITLDLNAAQLYVNARGDLIQDGVRKAQLAVKTFDVKDGLTPEEDTLIAMLDPAAQEQNAAGKVRAGYLETSNVNIAEQMLAMISAQRAYEMNARAIRNIDTGLNQGVIRAFSPR